MLTKVPFGKQFHHDFQSPARQMCNVETDVSLSGHLELQSAPRKKRSVNCIVVLEGPENYRAQEMASEIRSKQRGVLRNNTWPVED